MKDFFGTFKHDTWVMPYLRKYKKLLALTLFLGLMTFFCGSALMFNSGYLISKAARHPYNILMIYVPIVLTRAFGIGRPAFRYAERITSHNWVLRIVSDFRKKLYQAVEKHAVAIRQNFQTGDVLSILADDIDHIENLYLRTVFPTVIALLMYLIIILALGYFSWWFGLLMLLMLGLVVIVMPLWSVLINGARETQSRQIQQTFYTQLTDAVMGLGDWLISGRQKDFTDRQDQPIDAIAKLRRRDHQFQWWRDFTIQIIFGVICLALLVWSSFYWTSDKASANWIAAFVLSVFPLVDAFQSVSQGVSEWPSYQRSIKRVNDLDTTPTDETDQTVLTEDFNVLRVADLDFQYTDTSRQIFKQLNLTLQAGEKLALLGPSGTGKSTLLKLILGDLQPTNGTVQLNDVPVSRLQNERAQLFGVLDQQPYLFNTSIMNNVRMGNEEATDDQVKAALKAVELEPLITALPDGYETVVEEGGARFSGGERQRIALARILLQDAPIIILDEPTVSLDPITEAHLLQTVFRVLNDKTILWVTHHLAGINNVDQVRFLEDGQFDMAGTPQDLYATAPRFKRLYDLDQGQED
ncbi:thiol reductant ABC exporter subunit CydC [Lactiplantibacillus fabifermentans]|uniref:Cytochrome D ABC transporter, ATP-binding and permease protein n=2 Tax=Lactiplantibacillus fabifermentans TaxID=483011 RepID=A0A0R2NRW0_9LACO|nr:thiol reductant ABC exporter subunit CydC [Lactiplantibacillus fabifermentans]ETY74820.1 cysteine ABC transporter ATP-binding protein [Lactiplantibacillus fabifermentans T30PCM01]KRO28406.1 cytochrome D ABC transporter, ATP-binding and permease protein [Lactiplantibacillus fabifermentans DSM 21115]